MEIGKIKNFEILIISIFLLSLFGITANASTIGFYNYPHIGTYNLDTNSVLTTSAYTASLGSTAISPNYYYVTAALGAGTYAFYTGNGSYATTLAHYGNSMWVSHDGSLLYIIQDSTTARIYYTSNNTLKGTASISSNSNPCIVTSHDDSKYYVSYCDSSGYIKVYWTANNSLKTTISGLSYPTSMSCPRSGDKLYTCEMGNGYIDVVNTSSDTIESRFLALYNGGYSEYVLASNDSSRILFTSIVSPYVTKLYDSSYNLLGTYNLQARSGGIDCAPDSSYFVIGASGTNTNYTKIYTANYTQINVTSSYGFQGISGNNPFLVRTITPSPTASFTGTPTSGDSPLAVAFIDASTGSPTSWLWNFGDGNTSTSQNPSHTYPNMGVHTVNLTATNAGGSNTYTRTNYITVGDINSSTGGSGYPWTSFFIYPSSGTPGFTATFTNWGSNYMSCLWDFGDGNTSTSANTTHTYYTSGYYNVSLNNSNVGGWNKVVAINGIQVYTPVTASATANVTTIQAGGAVALTDTSTGSLIDTWGWNIPQASISSTAQNLIVSFANPGSYTVTHTASSSVSGSGGTVTYNNMITVTNATGLTFTANATAGTVPMTVQFTDTSSPANTGWSWTFGDNTTSTSQNPIHTYSSSGIYTVSLSATNANGTRSLMKVNYIQVYPANFGGIDGYVYDANTGAVIESALLTMQNSSATASTYSDSNGVYYFWPVYNGVYNLTTSKSGYGTVSYPNTIINGSTTLFNIYLTPNSNQATGINATTYSNRWLTYTYSVDTATNMVTLAYTMNTTANYSNFTVWNGNSIVYNSNVATNSGTFTFTGNANNNYAITYQAADTVGDTYNGVFSAIFYRGLPTGYSPFPRDYPAWLLNLIVIGFAILMLLIPGSAYNWLAGVFVELVLAVGYYWGLLSLGQTNVVVLMGIIAVVTVAEYMKFHRRIGD